MKKLNSKIYSKGIIALMLLIFWTGVATTGIIMWMAPHGQGMGSKSFFLNMNRHDWGDIHLYLALTAIILTIIHVIIDWKQFVNSLKHIIRVHQIV